MAVMALTQSMMPSNISISRLGGFCSMASLYPSAKSYSEPSFPSNPMEDLHSAFKGQNLAFAGVAGRHYSGSKSPGNILCVTCISSPAATLSLAQKSRDAKNNNLSEHNEDPRGLVFATDATFTEPIRQEWRRTVNFDSLALGRTPYFHDMQEQIGAVLRDTMRVMGGGGNASSGKQPSFTSGGRRFAAAIEDRSFDFGDFFKGKLPKKFLMLIGLLALSRIGIYIPLSGIDRAAFAGKLDEGSFLGALDAFSGGGIGRLGISSLGIVPFVDAQIVVQLLVPVIPKLEELQRREGEAGRKKVLQYTRYASYGFAVVQAIGELLYLRPYVDDFNPGWALLSISLLTLGSAVITYISEKISDLKLGSGTSLIIFTNIVSYLPASFGRTVAQAVTNNNYTGLVAILGSFFLLVFGIVYVQEAERKIPINYAGRYSGVPKVAYLPFKVNSSGMMPIIFSTSLLALPSSIARFTGVSSLKSVAAALNNGGPLYLPANVILVGIFNYLYTFMQLNPADVSEQLKRQGASVPSVRPGKATATFIENILARMSVLGSAFLAVMLATPTLVEGVTHLAAFRGFAGTSLLILVGCATDTARKVQAELVSQKYKVINVSDFDDGGLK